MNNSQRILLSTYIPITTMILVFDHVYPGSEAVQITRYIVMVALAISSITVGKLYREQRLMSLAFPMLVAGDFFLVISWTMDSLERDLATFGIVCFGAAYVFLAAAYRKKLRFGAKEGLTAMPVFLISGAVYLELARYMEKSAAVLGALFGLALSNMVWAAVSAPFSGHYAKKASLTIASSGVLMYICDIGVAFSIFHPVYSATYSPWLKNVVWGAYMMGWILLAVIINEKELLESR